MLNASFIPAAYQNLPGEPSGYPAEGDFFPELTVIIDFTESDGGGREKSENSNVGFYTVDVSNLRALI